MKKFNIPLIVGLIIVLGITFLIFFGEYFAPYDPSAGEPSSWVITESGKREFKRAPYMPDKNYLFGTDNAGRDVLSLIMAGAKNTFIIVFLATLLRFLVAIPIAFFAAFGEPISKRLITIFSSIFSAVPSLLICIMILKIDDIKELELEYSILAFTIVFTIVGWGRLASVIEEKIKDILNQDFIQGSIAIGKSKFAIATQNVTAHIMPWLVVYTFLEIAFVLLLLAQLGIFEVFVGNKQIFTIKALGNMTRSNYNYFPEWGAMLASTKRSISGNRFWLSIFPLLAFSISIVGFNLLGEGLNHELNKRNSKFISNVNKFWYHLSPLTFISELRHFKQKRKIIALKTTVIICIMSIILIPILNSVSIVNNSVMAHVMDINDELYEGRLIGTTGHDQFSNYIEAKLKEYKISPLFDGSYTSEFNINPTINIISESEFIIKDKSGELIDELKYKVEYYFNSWISNSNESLEGEILTSQQYLDNEFDPSKEYFLILDSNEKRYSIYDEMVENPNDYKYIKGVLTSDLKAPIFTSKKADLNMRGLTRILDNFEGFSSGVPPIEIKVGKVTANKLWSLSGRKITINVNIQSKEGLIGKNVGGIIEGKKTENPIIIATSYDYLGIHDLGRTEENKNIINYKGLYENGTSIAGSLEIAKNLGEIRQTPDRTIIFLFLDATQITIEGIRDVDRYGILDQEPLLIYLRYMGINSITGKPEDNLYHHTILDNTDTSMEQEFHKWLRRYSNKSGYYVIPDVNIKETSLFNLEDKEMVAIVLQGLKETQKSMHMGMEQSNLEKIDTERLTAHTQYLLDSILDMAYGGKGWTR